MISRSRAPRGVGSILLAGALIPLSVLSAFLYLPDDADQGFSQKIFYFHVPIALITYGTFAYGAVAAAMYLRSRDPKWDLRSYVGIHAGTIWGTLTLITGAIWARVSWGVWWNWQDKQLNVFLILFLFYCAYFMLRFSIEEGERRMSFSAVYVLLGIGLIPLSILAVRIASTLVHPVIFEPESGDTNMPGSFFLTFLIALTGLSALAVAMVRLELAGKRLALRLRECERKQRGEDI